MAISHKEKKMQEKRAAALPVGYKSFSAKDMKVEGRTVTGYLAAFNNIDSDYDLLIKGCFAKSLADRGVGSTNGNKIAHLWQHKMDEPLGTYTVLEERDFGLYFECVYDDVPKANQALIQFKSGTLANFSIGYSYIWDKMEWDDNKDCCIIKELNLYEGSVVTLAANPLAHFVGLKGVEREDEIQILKEEATEAIAGIKNPRKRYELGQMLSKLLALAEVKPPAEDREALKLEAEKKKKEAEQAAKNKGGKLQKMALLLDGKAE
jgi:HK97 family phage prohead protease